MRTSTLDSISGVLRSAGRVKRRPGRTTRRAVPADLAAQGYAVESADRNLRTLAHMSRWMTRGLAAGQLSAARLEEFLGARRAASLLAAAK